MYVHFLVRAVQAHTKKEVVTPVTVATGGVVNMRRNGKHRFFYHYFRQKDMMTIHFDNVCYLVNDVVCQVSCETKWSVRQPRLRMVGWATRIETLVSDSGRVTGIIW